MFPNVSVFTVGVEICFYAVAYYLVRVYKDRDIFDKNGALFVFAICSAFAIRFLVSFFADGTRFYDCLTVTYTMYTAAFSIMGLFAIYMNSVRIPKWGEFICKISFEIYLCHYMFIVGPVSLMGETGNWLLDSIWVVFVSVVVAWGVKKVHSQLT